MANRLLKFKFLGVYFLLFVLFTSCENSIDEVNQIASLNQANLPSESVKNVEIIYSDSARVRAKLKSKELNRYPTVKNPYMEMPKGLEVIFYNEHRKQQSKLTANYGIAYENNNNIQTMEVKNKVVVINEKGDMLETEHLIWNALTKKIYTDEFVKITTKEEIIMGTGLMAEQDFSEYEIKNVKGRIDVKDDVLNK
jgi:LPS export ABC transporter protein LptC